MNKVYLPMILLALAFSHGSSAATINNFSDWGISSSDLSSSLSDVHAITEDQHTYYLNPGYGGQEYDVEAIYTTWDNDYLYVGIMTGREQNPTTGWAPGDIAFDLGSDNSFEFGLVTSSATGSHSSTAGTGNPGEFYAVSEWNYGIWDENGNHVGANSPLVDKNHPTNVKTGIQTGSAASFSYSALEENGTWLSYGNWSTDKHYFISAKIDLDLFLGTGDALEDGFSIHWTANCNNDWLLLDVAAQPTEVSEPVSLALMSLGLLGLGLLRRTQKKK